MADEILEHDGNNYRVGGAVTDDVAQEIRNLKSDSNGYLLVEIVGGGGGTIGGSINQYQIAYGSAANTITGSDNFQFTNTAISGYNHYFKNNGNLFNTGANGLGSMVTDGTTWIPGTSIGGVSYVHKDGAYMGASNTVAWSDLTWGNDGNYQLLGHKSGVNQTWGVVTDAANLGVQIQSNNNGGTSYVQAFADGIVVETQEVLFMRLQSYSTGQLREGQVLNIRDENFATAEFDYVNRFNRLRFDISGSAYQMDDTIGNTDDGLYFTTNTSAATLSTPVDPVNGYLFTIEHSNDLDDNNTISDPTGREFVIYERRSLVVLTTKRSIITFVYSMAENAWIATDTVGYHLMEDEPNRVTVSVPSRITFVSMPAVYGLIITAPLPGTVEYCPLSGLSSTPGRQAANEVPLRHMYLEKISINVRNNTTVTDGILDLNVLVNGSIVATLSINPGVTGIIERGIDAEIQENDLVCLSYEVSQLSTTLGAIIDASCVNVTGIILD